MGVHVLQVFRFAAVDVARQVEVEIVLGVGNFGEGHHAGIARAVDLSSKDIHNLVYVLLTQTVFVTVLDVALCGVDYEHALAGGGVFLV